MKNFKKLVLVSTAALALATAPSVLANSDVIEGGDVATGTHYYYDPAGQKLLYTGTHEVITTYGRVSNPAVVTEIRSAVKPDGVTPFYSDEAPIDVIPAQDGIVNDTKIYNIVNGVWDGNEPATSYNIVQRRVDGERWVGTVDPALRPNEVVNTPNPEDEIPTAEKDENCPTPEVINIAEGVDIHKVAQGDKILTGQLDSNLGYKWVVVEKNGKVIGKGKVDESGHYSVELTEAVEFGNDLDIYGLDSDREDANMSSIGHHKVELVAPTADYTPVEVYTASSTFQGGTVSGKSRPFDKITLVIKNGTTVIADDINIVADANGYWSFQSATLIKKGYKVEVYSTDTAGNVSESTSLKVDDTSAIGAPAVRRAYENDKAITISTQPYANYKVTYNGVEYFGKADANGLARINVDKKLVFDEEFVVETWIRGGEISKTTPRVGRKTDNVKPVAPTIDTVAEGQTLITGTGEAFSLIELFWHDQKTQHRQMLYAIVNEEGNWFIDLIERCVAPFSEGEKLIANSYDNAENHEGTANKTVVDATKVVNTTDPTLLDPNDKDKNYPDPNDLTPAEPGEEKPGEEKPGEEKPGEEKPGEEKPGSSKETKKSSSKSSAKLPETGEATSYAIFGAAALSILAGLGLVAPKFNKEN